MAPRARIPSEAPFTDDIFFSEKKLKMTTTAVSSKFPGSLLHQLRFFLSGRTCATPSTSCWSPSFAWIRPTSSAGSSRRSESRFREGTVPFAELRRRRTTYSTTNFEFRHEISVLRIIFPTFHRHWVQSDWDLNLQLDTPLETMRPPWPSRATKWS